MIRGYYFITDDSLSRKGTISDVKNAVKAGVTAIQYRKKGSSPYELLKDATALRAICRKSLFIINNHVDIALAVGADGVHLGQGDLPCNEARKLLGEKMIIGVTVHDPAQAGKAEKDGADYLGVSPIFKTSTKNDAGPASGTGLITSVRKASSLPIVAIGGITMENAPMVIASGADALCAISAVVTKKDVVAAIKGFQVLFGRKN